MAPKGKTTTRLAIEAALVGVGFGCVAALLTRQWGGSTFGVVLAGIGVGALAAYLEL